MEELVGLALRETPLLGSQDARVEQSRLAALQARIWSGPSVELTSGRRSEGAFGGPRYALALAQPIAVLGKPGLRGRLLDLETEASRARRSAAQITVTLGVLELCYDYAVDRRKAAFVRSRQKRFELIHEYLAGRVFPTPQRKSERSIVQNRLKTLSSETIRSEAGYKAALEKLRVYVPLESGTYPDIDVPWFSGHRVLAADEWLAKTLERNPDLRVQKAAVESAAVEKSLASRDGLPEPSLVAAYEQGKAAETERNFGVGVGLALPPWNRNRSGIKSAEQNRLAEERLLAFEERKLKAEVPRILVEYEAARQIVAQYPEDLLPKLDEQLEASEQGFRKGQVDLLTFLELDSSATETFNRVLDAQQEFSGKIAELMAAAGEEDVLPQLASF